MQRDHEPTREDSVTSRETTSLALNVDTNSIAADTSKVSSISSASPTSSLQHLSTHSLSSRSNSDNTSVRLQETRSLRRRRSPPPTPVVFSFDPQGDELKQIKDSVERLRAQRTHVEQLRQRNERLELLLSERAKENEKLRLHVVSLKGVEQENFGLLKSFQLLEERIRTLEANCHDRQEQVRAATERLAAAEKSRDTLQLRVDELSVEREHYRQQLGLCKATHEKRVEQLQSDHEKVMAKSRRVQNEWENKMRKLEQSQSSVELKFQEDLRQLQRENQKLVRENREMEQRVQQLLATTVRQTTMIEDCDRLLSESKARHETSQASYRDQLKLNASLQDQLKKLEIELSTCEQGSVSERNLLEKKVVELESKVQKAKDKTEIYAVALHEKEKQCEKLQSELTSRERARFHIEEVAKDLRQKEKALLSEISGLKLALTDVSDEKHILQDQIRGLHEQLESERRDRSRWASARLKLLAEFCDEETKLSSALHHYTTLDATETVTSVGSEALDEMFEGVCADEDSVEVAMMDASVKMDAMEQHLKGASTRRRRSPSGKETIVFG